MPGDWRKREERLSEPVLIAPRELTARRSAAHAALRRARTKGDPWVLDQALRAAEEADAEFAERAIRFVFRYIGRRALNDLASEFPATPEQTAAAEAAGQRVLLVDIGPYTRALIAASVVEPADLDVDELYGLDEYSDDELRAIELAALTVNGTGASGVVKAGNA